MPAKKTLADVVALGKTRGFKVLSKTYVNSDTKLDILWNDCEHKDSAKSYDTLKQGVSCGRCFGSVKNTLADVIALGKELGFVVLSKKYIDCHTKLDILWNDCEHKDSKSYNALGKRPGCHECHFVTLNDVIALGKARGFTILSKKYLNSRTKLDIRWNDCDHRDSKSYNTLLAGQACWCNQAWRPARVAEVIYDLRHTLASLSTAQRQIILEKGKQLEGLKKSIQRSIIRGDFFKDGEESTKSDIVKQLDTLGYGGDNTVLDDLGEDDDISKLKADVDKLSGFEPSNDNTDDSYEGLPPAVIEKRLNTVGESLSTVSDDEAIREIVALEVDQLWSATLNNAKTAANLRKSKPSNKFAKEVRETFLAEYDAVTGFALPKGFGFKYQPTLMQRLCAYRIKTKRRYGNWSGMGSGKTGGAALASRLLGANLTVVVCPNNSAELESDGTCQWGREIQRWFPGTIVATKTWTPDWKGPPPRYLILNHEMFQQPAIMESIQTFLASNSPDFIVVDEVHMVKQRSDEASRRRQALMAFIAKATKKNPDLALLAMSGTPVINVLKEGASQLELLEGAPREDLPLTATASNCIKMHRGLLSVGFRERVKHANGFTVKEVEVDCTDAISDLRDLGPNPNAVAREEILTELKIPAILKQLKKGVPTLIYTHYVGDDGKGNSSIIDMLTDACRAKGLKVGVYTGTDKSGKAPFIAGKLDVLVASSSIATGVDGLQNVCHKLVINVLPWTRAEFDQLIGRLYRKGQTKAVEVVIPVTTTQIDGVERSWCRRVLSILKYKKTIADAAVDGVWPEGELESAPAAWQKWLDSLGGEVVSINSGRKASGSTVRVTTKKAA